MGFSCGCTLHLFRCEFPYSSLLIHNSIKAFLFGLHGCELSLPTWPGSAYNGQQTVPQDTLIGASPEPKACGSDVKDIPSFLWP